MKRLISRRQSPNKHRAGATTVEMALVLPIFFVVVLGFIEITRLYTAYNNIQIAALQSVRACSLPNANATSARQAAAEFLKSLGYDSTTIQVTTNPAQLSESSQLASVTVVLELNPLGEKVRFTTSRLREDAE